MAEYTIQARPTTYRGILMRSRLEANFASLLDRWRIEWEYEPRCYADETGQYLPDFVTHGWWLPRTDTYPGGRLKAPVFVETKPASMIDREVSKKMMRIRASEPNSVLIIWSPETIGMALCAPGTERWVVGGMARCVFCSRMFIRNIGSERGYEAELHDSCHVGCVIEGSLITVSDEGEWQRTETGYELFQEYA